MSPEQLKASILQYAIQGKLVEQRPEEGTAEDLYNLIKENHPVLKESKGDLVFDAIDFDIPENWKWVELNQLYEFVDYRGKTPNKISEGVFLITASNIRQGYMDYTRKEHISKDEYETRKSRGITVKGDLLFTTEAPMGYAAICDLEECSCGQRVITFKEYVNNTAFPKLFMFFILSPSFQKELIDNCTGTTAKGIKADKLKHLRLPLPPIEEQHRIVAKIEELLPFVDRYAEAYAKLEKFNAKFPEDMKKSILQYAIMGKLVEQRPEEGSAEEDFVIKCKEDKEKSIIEGKYRKESYRGKIVPEDVPFEIPDSWMWMYISDMSLFQEGPGILGKDFRTQGIPLIRIAGMQGEEVSLAGCNYLDPQMVCEKWEHFKLDYGDIVISTSASMDKIAEVKEEAVGAIPYTGLIRFKMYGGISKEYFKWFIRSSFYMSQVDNQKSGGTIKHYGPTHLKQMIVPIPPLEEQNRIVAKIEELLPYCEMLK